MTILKGLPFLSGLVGATIAFAGALFTDITAPVAAGAAVLAGLLAAGVAALIIRGFPSQGTPATEGPARDSGNAARRSRRNRRRGKRSTT